MAEPIDGMSCPRCEEQLVRELCRGGSQPTCPACGGRGVTVAMLRRFAPLEVVRACWRAAAIDGSASSGACPGCSLPMTAGSIRTETGELEIEGCRRCQLLWFDAGELHTVSPGAQEPHPWEVDETAQEHQRWLARQRDKSRDELIKRLEAMQARWFVGFSF